MKTLRSIVFVAATFLLLSRIVSSAWSGENGKSPPGKGNAAKSYQIANKKYGDLLRPKDANGQDGTPLVLYSAQRWKCMTWKLAPTDNSCFTVRNHFTGKTFGVGSKGNAIIQAPLTKDPAKAVQWRFMKLADGKYRIADPKSGNVLTAVKDDTGEEIRIVILPWSEKDEQKWELQEINPADLTM